MPGPPLAAKGLRLCGPDMLVPNRRQSPITCGSDMLAPQSPPKPYRFAVDTCGAHCPPKAYHFTTYLVNFNKTFGSQWGQHI